MQNGPIKIAIVMKYGIITEVFSDFDDVEVEILDVSKKPDPRVTLSKEMEECKKTCERAEEIIRGTDVWKQAY